MPAAPDPESARSASSPSSILHPLSSFLTLQLSALALSAARVPFSPRLSQPFELYAPQVMLFTQLTAATLLFPFLFRTRAASIAMILTAPPFLAFAAVLADVPLSSTALPAAYLLAYLTSLALCRALVRDPRSLQFLLTTFLFAGPLLLYLSLEFGSPSPAFTTFLHLTTLLAAFDLLAGQRPLTPWLVPVLLPIFTWIIAHVLRPRIHLT